MAAPGYYGCKMPAGYCGCPQDTRHKCQHSHWVERTEMPGAHKARCLDCDEPFVTVPNSGDKGRCDPCRAQY